MRCSFIAAALLVIALSFTGCNGEGVGNPFGGSQWTVGQHHLSFSKGVADWDTANNRLVLKFSLSSGATYPNAEVIVEGVTTLAINVPKLVTVKIAIDMNTHYESKPSDTGAQATVTFTRLDITNLGGVSGEITGLTRSDENPSETPVNLQASFKNMPVTN